MNTRGCNSLNDQIAKLEANKYQVNYLGAFEKPTND